MDNKLLFPDTHESQLIAADQLQQIGQAFYTNTENQVMTTEEIIKSTARDMINTLMIRTFQVQLDKYAIRELGRWIKLINIQATGVDNVDVEEASSLKIGVMNVPVGQYAAAEVAEFTFAQILGAAKKIQANDTSTKNLMWRTADATDLLSLNQKTMGVVGFGNIGSRVAKIAQAFGMKVISSTARPSPIREREHNVRFVDLKYLLKESDFIVFATPLNKETEKMLNRDNIGLIKESTVVVNVGRGRVIDEEAMAQALDANKIFAFCTDVYSQEPVTTSNPILSARNTILAPHVAWKTRDTIAKSFDIWYQNVRGFYAQDQHNLINPQIFN